MPCSSSTSLGAPGPWRTRGPTRSRPASSALSSRTAEGNVAPTSPHRSAELIDLAPTEHVAFVAGEGQHIDGWLTTPSGTAANAFPLVLQVHGGPHYPVGERFSYDAQRLAALGIAVLRANPRGSQGYGERFAAAVAGDWGGGDVDDLLALLDDVIATHPVDPQRIAVIGESYGGFVTLTAIARSDRFAAALAENCVADLDAAIPGNPDFWHAELGVGDSDRAERSVARAGRPRRADDRAAAADPRRGRRRQPDRPERGDGRGARSLRSSG